MTRSHNVDTNAHVEKHCSCTEPYQGRKRIRLRGIRENMVATTLDGLKVKADKILVKYQSLQMVPVDERVLTGSRGWY